MAGQRTALITGAARRIGAAIARDLARSGWRVVVHYSRSEADAKALASEIERAGGTCYLVRADLASRADLEAIFPRALEKFDRIDCLINNAAAFQYDTIETLSWPSWDAHIVTNLAAPAFLCRDFARQVPKTGAGVIINLIDQKVANLNPDFLSYTVSKVGLRGLTETLALALAPRIRVCGIAPGVTLISGKQTQQSFEKAFRATPLGRSSTIEDIVGAVRFILSTPSITGQVLTLDGGESLAGRPRDVAFQTK
ncbi:MAG TPA: SDR family oxidoreductase [Stellaceae bacterium]|nr:SDR family oxidoreductase [Stellaceae bacterium]